MPGNCIGYCKNQGNDSGINHTINENDIKHELESESIHIKSHVQRKKTIDGKFIEEVQVAEIYIELRSSYHSKDYSSYHEED